MKKRTVLITGGTRGIGYAMVKEFAAADYNIAFCYKNSDALARDICAELIKNEVNCLAIKCDITKSVEVLKMYNETKATFGFVDTLINNAGISHIKLFTDETNDDFDNIVNTNLKGLFNVTRLYLKDMVNNMFGRIINLSSIWGVRGASMETLYSMTKAASIGLTKALALEVAPSGVTVNAIAPGFIDTDMNKCFTPKEIQNIVEEIPTGKIGRTSDISRAALFLADEKNNFLTGQIININGGVI